MKPFTLATVLVGTALLVAVFLCSKGNEFNDKYVTTVHHFYTRVDDNIPKGSVLIVGDSLVQGLATSSLGPDVFNFGIGTDTAANLAHRLAEYQSVRTAKCVVVHIGVNDLFRGASPEVLLQDYGRLLATIPGYTRVILSSLLPLDGDVRDKLKVANQQIPKVNLVLHDLANENEQYVFHNIWHELLDSDAELRASFHRGDGLHLSGLGNAVWLDSLHQLLMKEGCVKAGLSNE